MRLTDIEKKKISDDLFSLAKDANNDQTYFWEFDYDATHYNARVRLSPHFVDLSFDHAFGTENDGYWSATATILSLELVDDSGDFICDIDSGDIEELEKGLNDDLQN